MRRATFSHMFGMVKVGSDKRTEIGVGIRLLPIIFWRGEFRWLHRIILGMVPLPGSVPTL